MKTKLINDINNYIFHLKQNGLNVSVHGKGISGLLEHNTHKNSYCYLVKTDDQAWQKCLQCQQKVFREYKKEAFFGMCHAGMEEYVFFVNDKVFVSVSGYGINRDKAVERMNRLTRNYCLEKAKLRTAYEMSLKHEPENMEEIAVVIRPLCHMLYLLQLLISDVPETETENTVYDSLQVYVQNNFMNDIGIKDIAQACACSESTVCHLFRQHAGVPIKKYIIELRIDQAKKMLLNSDLPISTIAQLCGFTNINYFPTAFRKYTGMSPTEYRLKIN
ncbi:MAG: helix-turn-helix transcriptional regulator [Lachnospiraceae bacterium]|nr:helix-turn-helix transcriptional regulator [Lachnospiraceae bacterium]